MLAGIREHPDHLHAARHAALPRAARRRRAVGPAARLRRAAAARGPGAGVHHRREFVGSDRVALVLGDNIFYGHGFRSSCSARRSGRAGATVFGYYVKDPERYGVVELDAGGTAARSSRRSRPAPKSNYAVTGLYFYDNQVLDIAAGAEAVAARRAGDHRRQSRRISSAGQLRVELMGRGYAWLDTGTHESLLQASTVHRRSSSERQGLKVACLEEIAFRMGYIDAAQRAAPRRADEEERVRAVSARPGGEPRSAR